MRDEVFFAFLLLWSPDVASCVKILEIRVPAHAAEGKEALLGCQFSLEGDLLYSIKWYKDGREFYRYVPKNNPHAAKFSTPGVEVDMTRSSSNVVSLVHLSKDSEGSYRCEVSGEAPLFTTAYEEKFITVQLLPEKGPRISGLQKQVRIGDRVFVNCTSPASRPEVLLTWYLNDQPVPRKLLQGPWYRVSEERPDATITILQLRFMVRPHHFQEGVMTIKCLATLAPLYQQHRSVERALYSSSTTTPSTLEEQPHRVLHAFQELSHQIRYGYDETTPVNLNFLSDDSATVAQKFKSILVLVLALFIMN